MKSLLCACIISYCAVASSGCGSNAAGMELLGSYSVMISSMGKSDPDVMTVTPGTDDKLLFTFAAGITTDVGAVNANGLRADLKSSSMIAIAAQPAHIDHSTGSLSGMVTGDGSLNGDGTCDVMLHFVGDGSTQQDYEISGTKE
ncbi:MAG TPA: hypothetical protein VN947_24470 [Polyangia bacterium]|nr:hypothetical protein [Polyangia bacterium]